VHSLHSMRQIANSKYIASPFLFFWHSFGAETQERVKIRGDRHTSGPANQDQDQNHGRHGPMRSNKNLVLMEKADSSDSLLADGPYLNNTLDRNGTGIIPPKPKNCSIDKKTGSIYGTKKIIQDNLNRNQATLSTAYQMMQYR
jgi:hypothetical protein